MNVLAKKCRVFRGPGFAPAGPLAPADFKGPGPGGAATPAEFWGPAPGGAAAPVYLGGPAGAGGRPGTIPRSFFYITYRGFSRKPPWVVGFFFPPFCEARRNKNPTPRKQLKNKGFYKKILAVGFLFTFQK